LHGISLIVDGSRLVGSAFLRDFDEPAERVDQAHLLGVAATHVQQAGAADENGEAAGAGHGDVEPVAAEENSRLLGSSSPLEVAIEKKTTVGVHWFAARLAVVR
jgi:hypothetical protein